MSKPTYRYTFTIDEDTEEVLQKLLKRCGGIRPIALFRHFISTMNELQKYGDKVTFTDALGAERSVDLVPKTRNSSNT